MLRHVGCTLPIELWHLNAAELPDPWRNALAPYGVDTMFTLNGGHVWPFYEAALHSDVRIVDTRHDEAERAVHLRGQIDRERQELAPVLVDKRRALLGGDGRRVTVTRDGEPVTDLQPYLGAFGHLVAIRDGDLAYLHVHPL